MAEGEWRIATSISNRRLPIAHPIKLLFLTPQLPYPPRQGTAIRNWGLIHHLARRGHAITLLSFVTPEQQVAAPELQAACERIITLPTPQRSHAERLRTLISPQADLARRLWSADYADALAHLLHEFEFDIVQIEGLELAAYFLNLHTRGVSAKARFIYDAHNAEYVLQRRALMTDLGQPARWPAAFYSAVQVPRLRQLERRVCQNVHSVTCVSVEDAAALRQLVPTLAATVIPNGIDMEAYTSVHHPSSSARLIFTGKMDYRPNLDAVLWFAREIFPRIRAVRPEAEFVVVGQQPPRSLQSLNGQNGVVVTGAVEEVRPYIASANVYVAPLRMGGGTRFKVLEAMALARPLVSTRVGAEGFAVTSGRELMLADSPREFAEAVLTLLNDSRLAQGLGQAGQAFVRAHYDWQAIVPKLEAIYEDRA